MAKVHARPANLHDVARISGVSYQTVSRVINNHPYVSPETRERVQKAIKELDYRPNRAARSLITGRSQTLQVVSTSMSFTSPLSSMANNARRFGYQLGLSSIRPDAGHEELVEFVRDLKSRLVDGIVILNVQTDFNEKSLESHCKGVIPFVQVGGNPDPSTPAVIIDQQAGAELVIRHLFELGHREIAEIPGPQSNYDALTRHLKTQEVLQEEGLSLAACETGDFTTLSGYQAATRLLEQPNRFSAVVCGNDEMAIGAIHAFQNRGLAIPRDISVVGFDDFPTAGFINPPLTTVRQDFIALGDLSIEALIDVIEQPDVPARHRVITPELVLRGSTQPFAGF